MRKSLGSLSLDRHSKSRLNFSWVFTTLSLLSATWTQSAWAVDPRAGFRLGFGQTAVTKSTTIRNEGPFAFTFYFEYPLSPTFTLGPEYTRTLSLSPFSSSVSFFGVAGKYYFWVPYPQKNATQEDGEKSFFVQKNFAPYAGLTLGYAQAAIPTKLDTLTNTQLAEVNAVAVYAALKLGVEYPLFGRLGVSSELTFATSVMGNASFQMLNLAFGAYWHF